MGDAGAPRVIVPWSDEPRNTKLDFNGSLVCLAPMVRLCTLPLRLLAVCFNPDWMFVSSILSHSLTFHHRLRCVMVLTLYSARSFYKTQHHPLTVLHCHIAR